jgi:hypothetical protein
VAELEDQVHALSHTMLSLEQRQGFTSRLLEENPGTASQEEASRALCRRLTGPGVSCQLAATKQ